MPIRFQCQTAANLINVKRLPLCYKILILFLMLADKLIFTLAALLVHAGWISGAGEYPRGRLIDTIACLEHPEQTYSLYLPVNCEAPAPLLVFLEPGARGKLPVELYRGLAEHYGFILACSNNGRNGPTHLYRDALDAMIPDVIKRFQDSIGAALEGIDHALYMRMDQLKPPEWWKNQGKQVRKEMESEELLPRESAIRDGY